MAPGACFALPLLKEIQWSCVWHSCSQMLLLGLSPVCFSSLCVAVGTSNLGIEGQVLVYLELSLQTQQGRVSTLAISCQSETSSVGQVEGPGPDVYLWLSDRAGPYSWLLLNLMEVI